MPLRPGGARRRDPPDPDGRAHRPGLARLPPGGQAGAPLRIPRRRPLRAPGRAPLQPAQAPPRSLRQGHRRGDRVERRDLRIPGRRSRRGSDAGRSRQRALRSQERRGGPRIHVGRRPATAHPVAPDRDLRGARQGLHHPEPGRPEGAAGNLRRPGLPGLHRVPRAPRRDRRRADARPPLRARPPPRRARPHQLLGLQHDRLLRARFALRERGRPRRAGARVQADGQGAPPGRDRGHPRRRLQPHRRGQPTRAHALLPRDRQRGLLPAGRRGPALLHGLHRMRQHARHDASPVRPAPHGQPPVLGVGDARRRLPLRPGLGPGAGAPRGRSPLVLLRRDPPGPPDQPGQAHRRALGPGGRRLPGGQLPGRLGRVERPLPRHDPPILEGGRRPGGGPRLPPHGIQRPLRVRRPPARRPA